MTGERAEESTARANYEEFEPHRSDNRDGKRVKRHVDQWRPVHKWTEDQVWEIIERYKVRPHPAYRLGWGRVSCAACIFGNANQWASLKHVSPKQFHSVSAYETKWGVTIKRDENISQTASRGDVYESAKNKDLARVATSKIYTENIIVEGVWELPSGAYGDSCGPT